MAFFLELWCIFLATCCFPQRGFSFADWTWRLIGATSPRTQSSPCGRWLLKTGGVWGSGWRSRNLGETMRASTSSLETLWAHFLYVLWLLHWTQNFYKRILWDKASTCSFNFQSIFCLKSSIIFTLLMIAEKHAIRTIKVYLRAHIMNSLSQARSVHLNHQCSKLGQLLLISLILPRFLTVNFI